jgi:hypothetical protein
MLVCRLQGISENEALNERLQEVSCLQGGNQECYLNRARNKFRLHERIARERTKSGKYYVRKELDDEKSQLISLF